VARQGRVEVDESAEGASEAEAAAAEVPAAKVEKDEE